MTSGGGETEKKACFSFGVEQIERRVKKQNAGETRDRSRTRTSLERVQKDPTLSSAEFRAAEKKSFVFVVVACRSDSVHCPISPSYLCLRL